MLKRTKVIVASMVVLLSIALISLGLILFVKDKEEDPTPTPVNVQYTESSLSEFKTTVAQIVNFDLNYNPTTDKMMNVLNMLGEEVISSLGLAFQDANIDQAKFNKVIAGMQDALEYIEISDIDFKDYFDLEALGATDGIAEAFGYIFDSVKRIGDGLDAGQIGDGEHEAVEAGELKMVIDSLMSAGLTGEELGRVIYHFLDNVFDSVLAHKTQINDGLKYYLDLLDRDVNIARLTGEEKLAYQYFQVMVLSASFVPSLITPAQKALHDAGEENFANEMAVMFSGIENLMNVGDAISSGKLQTLFQSIKEVDLDDESSLSGVVTLLTQTMNGYAQTLRDTKTTAINSLGVERTGTLVVSESLMNVLMSLENKIVPLAHLFISLGDSKVNPVLFMGSTILETASVVVNGAVDSVINVFDLLAAPEMAEVLVKILVKNDQYFSDLKFPITTQEEVYAALTSEKVKNLEIYPSIAENICLATKININSPDFAATDLKVEKSTFNGEEYMSVLDVVRLTLVNSVSGGLINSMQGAVFYVDKTAKEYLSVDPSYDGPNAVVLKRNGDDDLYVLTQQDIARLLNNTALEVTLCDIENQSSDDEVVLLMKLATAFLGAGGDSLNINDEFFFVLAETGISEKLITEAVSVLVDGLIDLELFGTKDYIGQTKNASYLGNNYSEEEHDYLSWSSDVTDEDKVWIMYYDETAGLYKRISKEPFNIWDKNSSGGYLDSSGGFNSYYDHRFYNDVYPVSTSVYNSNGLYIEDVLLLLRNATGMGALQFNTNSYSESDDFRDILQFIVQTPSISLDDIFIDWNENLINVSNGDTRRSDLYWESFNPEATLDSIVRDFVLQYINDTIATALQSDEWNNRAILNGVYNSGDEDLDNFMYLMENAGRTYYNTNSASFMLFEFITTINSLIDTRIYDESVRNIYKIALSEGIESYMDYEGQPEKFEADKAKLMAFMQLPENPTDIDYKKFALGIIFLTSGDVSGGVYTGIVEGSYSMADLVRRVGSNNFLINNTTWGQNVRYLFKMNTRSVILTYLGQKNISSDIKTMQDLIAVLNDNYAYLPEYATEIYPNLTYGQIYNNSRSFDIVDREGKIIPGATRAIMDKITEYFVSVVGESVRNEIQSNNSEIRYFQSLARIYLSDTRFREITGLFSLIDSLLVNTTPISTIGLGEVMTSVQENNKKLNNGSYYITGIPQTIGDYRNFVGIYSGDISITLIEYFPLVIVDFVSALNKNGANIDLSSFEREDGEETERVTLSYKLIDTSDNTQAVGYDVYNSIKTDYIKFILVEEVTQAVSYIETLGKLAFEQDKKYIGSSGYNLREMFSPFALSISSVQELAAYINATFVENPSDSLVIVDTLTEEQAMEIIKSYESGLYSDDIVEILGFENARFLSFLNDNSHEYQSILYNDFRAPYVALIPYIQQLIDNAGVKPEGMSDYDWYYLKDTDTWGLENYKNYPDNMLSLFSNDGSAGDKINRLIDLLNSMIYKNERFLNKEWYSTDWYYENAGYVDGDNYIMDGEEYPITLSSTNTVSISITIDYTNMGDIKVFLDGERISKMNGMDIAIFTGYSVTKGEGGEQWPAWGYNHLDKTATLPLWNGIQYSLDYSDPDDPRIYGPDGVKVTNLDGENLIIIPKNEANDKRYLFIGSTDSSAIELSSEYIDPETYTATKTIYTHLYVKYVDGTYNFYLNPDFSDTPKTTINGEQLSVEYRGENSYPVYGLLIGESLYDITKYAHITGEYDEIIARVNISSRSIDGNTNERSLNVKLDEILTALNEDFNFGFDLERSLQEKLSDVRNVLFGGVQASAWPNSERLFRIMGARNFFDTFIKERINDIMSEIDIMDFGVISDIINKDTKTCLTNLIDMINAKLVAYGYIPSLYSDTSSIDELLDILKDVLSIQTYDDLVRNLYIRNDIRAGRYAIHPEVLFEGENSIGELALVRKMVDSPSYMLQMLVGRETIKIDNNKNSYAPFYISHAYENDIIDWFNTAFNDKDIFTEDQKAWVLENLYDYYPDTEDRFDFSSETIRQFLIHVDRYEEKVAFNDFISFLRYQITPLLLSVPYMFSGQQIQSIGLGFAETLIEMLASMLSGMAG